MRRTILFSLFALLALSAANHACAQRRARSEGYGYLPYDSGVAYDNAPQPDSFVQPPPPFVQPPAPPVVEPPGHAAIAEYNWPAAAPPSSPAEPEPQPFAIVLKNGSTLSAVAVFASDDGLHYVDPNQNHLRISISEVDRGATLKLNRARNLNLYLPAAQ
jgi:hypothetical protein